METTITRHPLLVDTSGLIAVANTPSWNHITENLKLTTTNVCKQELKRHAAKHEYAPAESREGYLRDGSECVLTALTSDASTFSCVTSVRRPHGPDAGEQSIQQEVQEHPASYRIAVLLDNAGRLSLRRTITTLEATIEVVGPPYLLYLLLTRDLLSRREFCEQTGEMIRTEGWMGYQAVKSAWEGIPVECSDVLEDDVLPP